MKLDNEAQREILLKLIRGATLAPDNKENLKPQIEMLDNLEKVLLTAEIEGDE